MQFQVTFLGRGNLAGRDTVVRIVGSGQLGELGALEGTVQADRHVPVAGTDRDEVERKLEALVPDGANVGQQGVGEVDTERDIHAVEQVLGVTLIPVEGSRDPVFQEAEVETDVLGGGLFPLDVRIVGGRSQIVAVAEVAHVIAACHAGGNAGTRDVRIIGTDILLTGHAPPQTDLHGGNLVDLLDEVLFSQVPGQRYGREETPAVLRRETGGRVVTKGERKQITALEGVIETSEEGQQDILLIIGRRVTEDLILLMLLINIGEAGLGIVVRIVAVPGVTGHRIDLVTREIVVVVGKDFNQGIVPLVVRIIVGTDARRRLIEGSPVGTDLVAAGRLRETAFQRIGGRQFEVFEAVDLIDRLCIQNRIETGARVGGAQGTADRVFSLLVVRLLVRSEISTLPRTIVEPTIEGRIVDAAVRIGEMHRHGRIEAGRETHDVAVVAFGHRSVEGEGQLQVVIQQGRSDGSIDGTSVIIRTHDGTALVGITAGHAPRELAGLRVTGHAEGMGRGDAELGHLILPVGAGTSIKRRRLVGKTFFHERAEFTRAHHIQTGGILIEAERTIIRNPEAGQGTLLGRHQDNAVGSTGTVDGGCGGVLEDGEGVDVIRVDHGEVAVGDGDTVHNKERVVRGVQGSRTTDPDLSTGTRSTVARNDHDAGALAAKEFIGIGDRTAVEFIGLDHGHGTGQVLLLDVAVTDDNGFFHHFGIDFQNDGAHACEFGGSKST